jgi:serine/threonine protein kinase
MDYQNKAEILVIPEQRIRRKRVTNTAPVIRRIRRVMPETPVIQAAPEQRIRRIRRVMPETPVIQAATPQRIRRVTPVIQAATPQRIRRVTPVIQAATPQRIRRVTPVIQAPPEMQEKQITTASKIGPQFVGEGTFGCVFKPPLECSIPCLDERCKHGVAKLMAAKDAVNEEYEFTKLSLDNIDPTSKYYFKKPYICDPKLPLQENVKLKNSRGDYCRLAHDSSIGEKKILFYDDGGIDLNKLSEYIVKDYIENKNTKKFINNIKYILRKLQNVFDGIAKLNENNIYHFDIKSHNIVTGIDHSNINLSNLPINNVFHIIDFGLAHKYENKDLAGDPIARYINFVRPLDIIYLSNLPDRKKKNKITRDYFNLDNYYLMYTRYIYQNEYRIFNQKDLNDFMFIELDKNNRTNRMKLVEQIFRTIDTFGLGVLLVKIYMDMGYDINDKGKSVDTDPLIIELSTKLYNFIISNNLMNYYPFFRPLVNGPNGVAERYKKFLTTL